APGAPTSGAFSFDIDLDGHVAVRRGRAVVPPASGAPGGPTVHEDLTVFHPASDGIVASYWDNEGHVLRYRLRSSQDGVVQESEPASGGPRFRLTYRRLAADRLEVVFAVAPPGGDFRDHVKGTVRRVSAPVPGPAGGAPAPPRRAAGS
ncbi:MAG TPA: hypothetical protein PLL32_08150, partial [Anaeromyxobacteraceae bacterium]|nr:hypothetical protein [Anaeromyxobacteraceae bacterium]